jgi:hypothetical protein
MRSPPDQPVTFKGSPLARWVLKLLGWHVDFEGFPTRQGSGFYQLALGAQVPLALVKIDWGRRRFGVVDFYDLTGHVEQDYAHMAQVYAGVAGFYAHQMGPIIPWRPVQADQPSPPESTTIS